MNDSSHQIALLRHQAKRQIERARTIDHVSRMFGLESDDQDRQAMSNARKTAQLFLRAAQRTPSTVANVKRMRSEVFEYDHQQWRRRQRYNYLIAPCHAQNLNNAR